MDIFNAAEHITNSIEPEYKRKAYAFYNDVYLQMSQEQMRAYNLAFGAWGFCSLASDAYKYASGESGIDLTDGQRLFSCGEIANSAISRFINLQELWKLDRDKTAKKIEEMERWLRSKGYVGGLPKPIDKEGHYHVKTAYGIYEDMVRYERARTEYARSLKAKADAAEGSRR